MKVTEFEPIVENRINKIRTVLAKKAKEYTGASGLDRLHNFNRASAMLGISREKALLGMWTKHIVSVLDIIDAFDTQKPTVEMIDEKIGDLINYAILLEAMMKEDISNGQTTEKDIRSNRKSRV